MVQKRIVYVCPHCKSPAFKKNGKHNGTQRYRCKKCNKTFCATTGTSTHHMHKKHLVNKYIAVLQKGLSVRKAAKEVGISKNTAFAWRHKFLASLASEEKAKIENNTKSQSIKMIRLPYSYKGRKKEPEKYTGQSLSLLITDICKTYIIKLSPCNPVKNASQLLSTFNHNNYIAPLPDKTLHLALNKTNRIKLRRNSEAFKLLEKEAKSQTLYVMEWMERFKGVATKYLNHYWHWFSELENIKQSIDPKTTFKELCLEPHSRKSYLNVKNL